MRARHDYQALALMLVQAGCEHIVEQAAGTTGGVGNLLVQAALMAQRNLVVMPNMELTSQDFLALTAELEKLAGELENSCPDVTVTNVPETCDDSIEWLEETRAKITEALEHATAASPQPTFEEATKLVLKAWRLINNAPQAAILARFRNTLVKAYVAEFKHAHSNRSSKLN